MAIETIEKVSEVEDLADNAEMEAKKTAKSIIEEAEKRAVQILHDTVSEAQKNGEVLVLEAQKCADKISQKAVEDISTEIKRLEKIAGEKEETVIKDIISSVV